MNTDKLMELVEKVRDAELFEDGVRADLFIAGVHTIAAAYMRGRQDSCDELAAALRAEQAVGDEQLARELLAEELRKIGPETMNPDGLNRVADSVLDSTYRFCVLTAALRAIRRALGTARQSEGVVVGEDVKLTGGDIAFLRRLASLWEQVNGESEGEERDPGIDFCVGELRSACDALASSHATAPQVVTGRKDLVILADVALRELGRIHEMLDDAIAKCELAKAEPTEGAVVAPIWREVEAMMVEFKAAWPADTSKSRRARANALCERFLRLRNHLRGWDGDKIESAWLAAATSRGGG